MADNPLYPGTKPGKPGKGPQNPMYPGYYTGKPLPRRPKPKGSMQPLEYNMDSFFEYLDELNIDISTAPRWIVDRLIDDFKQELKAKVKPGDIEATQLDDYEEDILPGAFGIGVSLNPEDLSKPGKHAVDTVVDWVKAASGIDVTDISKSDFQDFERRENKRLWAKTLGISGDDTDNEEKQKLFEKNAVEAIREGTVRGYKPRETLQNPLSFRGIGVKDEHGNDIYEQTANAAVNAALELGNPLSRDKKSLEFIKNAAKAIKLDLKHNGLDENDPVYGGTIALYSLKTGVLSDMDWVNGAVFEAKKRISIRVSGGPLAPSDAWEELEYAMEIAKAKREECIRKAKALANQGKILQQSYEKFKESTKFFGGYLENLEDYIEKTSPGVKTNPENDTQVIIDSPRKALNDLNKITSGKLFGKAIAGGDVPGTSILTHFGRILEDEMESPENKDEIGWLIQDPDYEQYTQNMKKIPPIMKRLKTDRITNTFTEVYEGIKEGKLLERYAWNTYIKPRLEYFTPAQRVKEYLQNKNYFNLIIKDDNVKEWQENSDPFNRLFTYRFNLDIKGSEIAKRLGKDKIKDIEGGGHFDIVKELTDIGITGKEEHIKNLLLGLVNLDLIPGNFNKICKEHFLYKLDPTKYKNLKKSSIEYANLIAALKKNKKTYSFFLGLYGEDSLDDVFIKPWTRRNILRLKNKLWKNFNTWIDNKGIGLFGKSIFGANVIERTKYRLELFQHLIKEHKNVYTLGIDKRWAGYLEKILIKLNKFATETKLGQLISKVTSFGTRLKTTISNKIRGFFLNFGKGLNKAGGPFSKFFAKFLIKSLSPLVIFLAMKAVEYAGKFIKGLAKGDFFYAFREMQEEAEKLIKGLLKIAWILFLIIAVPFFAFGGLTDISTSPIDPTLKSLDFNIGAYWGFPPGENYVVKVKKDVVVTLPGEPPVTNPKEIPNEKVDGARVDYVVSITPKMDIYDNSVQFYDKGKVRSDSGTTNLFPPLPSQALSEFRDGKTITINLKTVSLNDGHKDSLIANTASVYTPAIHGTSIEADVASYTRYFKVGKFVPECPLGLSASGYSILTTEYKEYGLEYDTGHGSGSYWTNICGSPDCYEFSIPWSWWHNDCLAQPDGPACKRGDQYYGYALDVSSNTPDDFTPVTLPPLGDNSRQWTIISKYTKRPGFHGFEATSGTWKIYYTHINEEDVMALSIGQTVKSGDIIGGLSTRVPGTPHVHIELIDMSTGGKGTPVKPSCFLCSEKPPAGCRGL